MNKDLEKVIIRLKRHKEIVSAYLYGSILSDRFNPKKSDVDILLIVGDTNSPNIFIDKIREFVSANSQNIKLDINLVFMSEFLNRWHIYRPPSYFIGIKHRNKLLWGEDLLTDIKDEEVTSEVIYKRIVDLAQSSRGIYLNGKEPEFWISKYTSWLKVATLEVLFLTGEFDLFFTSGVEKLKNKYSNIDFLDHLTDGKLTIKELNHIAENLRILIYDNFIKKK
jgi:predicted nucleotidyltransferase